jgi:hypothetical protein
VNNYLVNQGNNITTEDNQAVRYASENATYNWLNI